MNSRLLCGRPAKMKYGGVTNSWARHPNQIGFTCIGSDSVCSSRSAEEGQVWLCEFLQNGVSYTVVVLFSGLKRGVSARARSLPFLRSSKRKPR